MLMLIQNLRLKFKRNENVTSSSNCSFSQTHNTSEVTVVSDTNAKWNVKLLLTTLAVGLSPNAYWSHEKHIHLVSWKIVVKNYLDQS